MTHSILYIFVLEQASTFVITTASKTRGYSWLFIYVHLKHQGINYLLWKNYDIIFVSCGTAIYRSYDPYIVNRALNFTF